MKDITSLILTNNTTDLAQLIVSDLKMNQSLRVKNYLFMGASVTLNITRNDSNVSHYKDLAQTLIDRCQSHAKKINESALHVAVLENKPKELKRLLKSKTEKLDVNYKPVLGMSALHLAAMQGNVPCIKILLEHKARRENVNSNGLKAVDLAVANGHVQATKTLLSYVRKKDRLRNILTNASIASVLFAAIMAVGVFFGLPVMGAVAAGVACLAGLNYLNNKLSAKLMIRKAELIHQQIKCRQPIQQPRTNDSTRDLMNQLVVADTLQRQDAIRNETKTILSDAKINRQTNEFITFMNKEKPFIAPVSHVEKKQSKPTLFSVATQVKSTALTEGFAEACKMHGLGGCNLL